MTLSLSLSLSLSRRNRFRGIFYNYGNTLERSLALSGSGLVREEFAGTLNENDTVSETVGLSKERHRETCKALHLLSPMTFTHVVVNKILSELLTKACGPD
ncbi:hypothetical protein F2Q70_00016166 [Brassica cretica]|uniref:Uncharacterized protein n=1 Tax=Brassica cretica TaxID=69181 RepID=A0A8S9I2U7_BRACR|nr:hypothetical protein F2Q70_00016166 [Brassica cretica]